MSDTTPPNEDRPADPIASDLARPSPDLVRIENVTKSFGSKTAVKDVSFSVPAGQICGLLGPNGAGKTTLFRPALAWPPVFLVGAANALLFKKTGHLVPCVALHMIYDTVVTLFF